MPSCITMCITCNPTGIPFVICFFVSIFYFFHKYDFFLRMGVAFYYCMCALYTTMVVSGLTSAKHLLRVHDMLFGHLMFLPLFVMAALQIPDKIQTWLLYHNGESGFARPRPRARARARAVHTRTR